MVGSEGEIVVVEEVGEAFEEVDAEALIDIRLLLAHFPEYIGMYCFPQILPDVWYCFLVGPRAPGSSNRNRGIQAPLPRRTRLQIFER